LTSSIPFLIKISGINFVSAVLIPNIRKPEDKITKLIDVAIIPYSDGLNDFPIINQKIKENKMEENNCKNK